MKDLESRVDAKSVELARQQASTDEAATKIQTILVAIVARERMITDELCWMEELHEKHLEEIREAHKEELDAHAQKALDYVIALSALEKDNAALWDQAVQDQRDRGAIRESVRKTGELLALRAKEIAELKEELAKANEYCTAVEQGRRTGIARLQAATDRAT